MGVAGDSDLSLNNGLKIIAVLTNGNWSQVVAPRNHWHHHYHTTVLFNRNWVWCVRVLLAVSVR